LKLFQTIFPVTTLVAILIACDDQFSGSGETVSEAMDEPRSHFFGQARTRDKVPSQYGFTIYLIDVLAAGTRASRV
jgi:hypothetical protein